MTNGAGIGLGSAPRVAGAIRGLRARRVAGAAVVALLVAVGLLLRLWVMGRQPTSSDEAIVGLMAREILRGHFSAFYWGQRYGGGEPYVVAAVFAVAGQSPFSLAATAVLLDAVAAALVWRIGRRLFGGAVGVTAALLFWVWPEVYVWQSTAEYGFRLLTLDCGLALLLVALELSGHADGDADASSGSRITSGAPLLHWWLLGVIGGLGWWCSPEIVYFVAPAGLAVAGGMVRHRVPRPLAGTGLAIVGAGIGAFCWLWDNIPDGFASLRAGSSGQRSYADHLRIFAVHVLPLLLGLRLRGSGRWLDWAGAGTSPAEVACAVLVVVLVAWTVRLAVGRRGAPLVVFVVLFPFVYAAFPETWYWQDGRYAVYLAPGVALLLASAAHAASGWVTRRWSRSSPRTARPDGRTHAGSPGFALAAVVAIGLALTLIAATELAPYRPEVVAGRTSWLSWRSDPNVAVVTLVHGLEAAKVHDAYAGYWLAYILDLEGRGRLVASDAAAPFVRYAPYLRAVEHARDPAWLFANPRLKGQVRVGTGTSVLDPGCAAKSQTCLLPVELESYLRQRHVAFRAIDVGDFVVIVPASRIGVATLYATFHVSG